MLKLKCTNKKYCRVVPIALVLFGLLWCYLLFSGSEGTTVYQKKVNLPVSQKVNVPPPSSLPPPPPPPPPVISLSALFHAPSSMMEYYSTVTTSLKPVVTVITPVYHFNQSKIGQTVASIKYQSLQNWEWIIVDDGHEENVQLKDFVASLNDKRIRTVRNGHLGLPGARNYAISQSRGIFYYPLDDDDLIGHHTLELLYFSLAANPDASFVNGYSYGFDHKQYRWSETYRKPELSLQQNLGTYAAMVRKDHWEAVGGYDSNRKGGLEDWDFTLKMMNENKWGYTIPEYVFWYRTRENQGTDRWAELSAVGLEKFIKNITVRYSNLKAKRFPKLPCPLYSPRQPIRTGLEQPNGIILAPLPKTKKRLMLIVPWLIVGGADKFNRDFVKSMVAAGWEVTIVCTLKSTESWRENFAQYTSDIFVLPNFLPYSHYPRFLRHLLVSRNPDVVMTSNSGLGYDLIPFLTASCPQAVFVDYAHAEHMSFFYGGWPKFASGLSPWYDINFAASSHLRQWMITFGDVAEDKVQVLHVGVYPEDYARNRTARAAFREEHEIAPGTKVVTFAARLDSNKQPTVFCEVAYKILQNKTHPALHFLVAGDGPERHALERCFSGEKIKKHVTLLGYQTIEEMKAVMSASDVLFLSSQMEGIPCVFYEAMAARIPVVGPGVGGISELVLDGVTGHVVQVKNGTEFDYTLVDIEEQIRRYTAALVSILSNPTMAKQMGKAGRKRISSDFNIEKIAHKFIKLIEKKQKQKAKKDNEAGMCHAQGNVVNKLNELASRGLNQATYHMETSPGYCTPM